MYVDASPSGDEFDFHNAALSLKGKLEHGWPSSELEARRTWESQLYKFVDFTNHTPTKKIPCIFVKILSVFGIIPLFQPELHIILAQ